jgi:hypothetical protein
MAGRDRIGAEACPTLLHCLAGTTHQVVAGVVVVVVVVVVEVQSTQVLELSLPPALAAAARDRMVTAFMLEKVSEMSVYKYRWVDWSRDEGSECLQSLSEGALVCKARDDL